MAVLRSILGIKDIAMAELLRCSPATIHSLEIGRLKLSERMRTRVVHETNVDADWLVRGNPRVAPVNRAGKAYTKEDFFTRQADKAGELTELKYLAPLASVEFYASVRSILRKAAKSGEIQLAIFKIAAAVKTLEAEFGSLDRPHANGATFIPVLWSWSQIKQMFKEDVRHMEQHGEETRKALSGRNGAKP